MKKYPWQFTKKRGGAVDYEHWEGNPMLERLRQMIKDEPNDQILGSVLREYIRSMG